MDKPVKQIQALQIQLDQALESLPRTPLVTRQRCPDKEVLCVLGIPGGGKSVLLDKLAKATECPVLHMRDFLLSKGVQQDDVQRASREGRLTSGFDEAFLDEVRARLNSEVGNFVFLDGFPRSPAQAELLHETATQHNWVLEALWLELAPGREAAQSFERQIARAASRAKGGTVSSEEVTRALAKTARSITHDIPSLAVLQNLGVPVHRLDSTRGTPKLFREVRDVLGISVDDLPWERFALEQLLMWSEECKIPSLWLQGEIIYRAFWNERFNLQLPVAEFSVVTALPKDVPRVRECIRRDSPRGSWSVASWNSTNPLSLPPVAMSPLRCGRAAVRLRDGKVECVFGEGAEADLRKGIVRGERGVTVADRALEKVRRLAQEYPLRFE
jgi:adenylate kinase family enzyme